MQTWLAQLGRKSGPRAPFFAPGNISAGFILKPREETLSMQFGVAWQGEIR
jgi:hypothetical protein